MQRENDFTQGKILGPLLTFMLPVFFAMLLQSMYGAVDLMIVGKFAEALDVSAVSTGSQIMMTLTNLVTSFAMGTTILLGRKIGEGKGDEAGRVIGSSICLFAAIALAFTVLIPVAFMQAMAAFVAQNMGADKYDRAKKALWYAIGVSTALAVVMFAVTFWHGDLLSGIFANDPDVITASAAYLKAYAID